MSAAASPSRVEKPPPLVVVRASWARNGVACPISRPWPDSTRVAERRVMPSACAPMNRFGNAEDEHLETLPTLKGGSPRRILAGKVSGAQGATAFVLFDPDLALGQQIEQDALGIGEGDHALSPGHPVGKSLDGLDPDLPHLTTGKTGFEGRSADRFELHREEAFGDSSGPVIPALGGRNPTGVQYGTHFSTWQDVWWVIRSADRYAPNVEQRAATEPTANLRVPVTFSSFMISVAKNTDTAPPNQIRSVSY